MNIKSKPIKHQYTPEEIKIIQEALDLGADALKGKMEYQYWQLHRDVINYILGVVEQIKKGRQ